jgi:hypothetical protein
MDSDFRLRLPEPSTLSFQLLTAPLPLLFRPDIRLNQKKLRGRCYVSPLNSNLRMVSVGMRELHPALGTIAGVILNHFRMH